MTGNHSKSWQTTTIREICEPTRVWNPQKEPRDEFWYVDVSAVSRDSLSIRQPQRMKASEAPSRARKLIRTGDTIFATVRPTLRRIAYVDQRFDDQIASTAFCVVRPNKSKAVPRFLYYVLQTDQLNEDIAKFESGASYPAVNDKDVLDRTILLPRPPEQGKIAAVLWKIQRAIETEEKLSATARELKQAAMRQLFTYGLQGESQKETEIGLLPRSWKIAPIRANAKLVAGGTPPRSNEEYWKNGTIPWVKTGEVDYCVITKTKEKITSAGLNNSAAKLLPKGTLLIAMYGQGITRGKVAILGIDATTNQACAAIVPTNDEVLPFYLYYFLTFSYDRLRSLSHGAQQQNLNAELVGGFQVAIPDPDEQREITTILQTIDRKISVHERKRGVLQELFQTMLHELMSGEIRVADLDIDVSEIKA
jgi:type I restriction enzyme S subunit